LPAEVPPVPSVEAEPEPEPLPDAEPAVPTEELDMPPPAEVPPVPNVELDCASTSAALPARNVAVNAASESSRRIIFFSPPEVCSVPFASAKWKSPGRRRKANRFAEPVFRHRLFFLRTNVCLRETKRTPARKMLPTVTRREKTRAPPRVRTGGNQRDGPVTQRRRIETVLAVTRFPDGTRL